MIIIGIQWKCEGHSQVTNIEIPLISTTGWGAAYMVYNNVF